MLRDNQGNPIRQGDEVLVICSAEVAAKLTINLNDETVAAAVMLQRGNTQMIVQTVGDCLPEIERVSP